MKFLLMIIGLSCVSSVLAQTDSATTPKYTNTYKAIAVLNKTDIERLPATNVIELVQGAFPFVGSHSTIEENYSFIVNEFVLVNPNSITIGQIEKISFYPAGTLLTRASMQKKGTFVIDINPENNALTLSTKTGLVIPDDYFSSGNTVSGSDNNLFTLNEFTYQKKESRSFISSSVSLLAETNPKYTYATQNALVSTTTNWNRIRISNFAGYRFNDNWSVEGGLFFTNQPGRSNSEQNFAIPNTHLKEGTTTSRSKVNYAGVHAAFSFTPSQHVRNIFSIESTLADRKTNRENKTSYSDGTISSNTREDFDNNKVATFSNQLIWQPLSKNVKLETSLLTRYRFLKTARELDVESIGPGNNFSDYHFDQETDASSISIFPSVNLSLKEFASAEIGITYDTYQNYYGSAKFKTDKQLFPSLGAKVDLASLFNAQGMSLYLSSNYNEFLTNYEDIDRFSSQIPPDHPGPIVGFHSGRYKPSKSWLHSIVFAGWKNRFSVQANYGSAQTALRSYTPTGVGLDYYYLAFENLSIKRFSVETKTLLIQQENKTWTFYTNLFKEKYTRESRNEIYRPDWVNFDAEKIPWYGGLRTSLKLNRFFAELSSLFAINELGIDKNSDIKPDLNRYNTNFFLAGYRLPVKSTLIKSIELNAQSRNLLQSKNSYSEKYIGLGATVTF